MCTSADSRDTPSEDRGAFISSVGSRDVVLESADKRLIAWLCGVLVRGMENYTTDKLASKLRQPLTAHKRALLWSPPLTENTNVYRGWRTKVSSFGRHAGSRRKTHPVKSAN